MKNTKYNIAYVGGTFDLFHPGHVNFLRKCKEIANYVVVSLNTDSFCAEYKREPILSYRERREMLKSCKYVDSVIENTGGKDSSIALMEIMPDVLIHGDDWTGKSLKKQLGLSDNFIKATKLKFRYIPYTKGISSTDIIKRCKQSK